MAVNKVCEHCGNAYQAARTSSKFCSDRCRVRHHRHRDDSVAKPFLHIAELIRQIGSMTEGELSFEAIRALKTIQSLAKFQDISKADSWWRCQTCWRAVQKELPQDNDCQCGKVEDARWQLQKRLL